MTAQSLLTSIKTLLSEEFSKSHITPPIVVGIPSEEPFEYDVPCGFIIPPLKGSDDGESRLFDISFILYAYCPNEGVSFDIFSFSEKIQEIIIRNGLLGAFRISGPVVWSIDPKFTRNISKCEINITYESVSSFQCNRIKYQEEK